MPLDGANRGAMRIAENDRRRSVDRLAKLALVMAVVFVGDEVGLHHHRDVGGVELAVDHRAVADEPAEPEIALDQRRQLGERTRGGRRSPAAAGRIST